MGRNGLGEMAYAGLRFMSARIVVVRVSASMMASQKTEQTMTSWVRLEL